MLLHSSTSADRTDILALNETERKVLSQIAAGVPIADVLGQVIRYVEAQSAVEMRASILFLDKEGIRLLIGAAPTLPASYNEAINGMEIGPAAGSCGTAAFRGEPVYVSDIGDDPLWAGWRHLALPHGLQACWSTPIRGASGQILGTFANYYLERKSPTPQEIETITVVTQTVALAIERHLSDQALRETEARHRQILNSTTEYAIVSTGLQGHITSWNEGAHRILGWSEQEMLGQQAYRFFTPEDIALGQVETEMRCALEQGHAADERWHVRKNGERFWASGEMTPLRNDAAEVIGFVKVLRDRTEQKRSEAELRQLNDSLESLVAQRTRERDRVWRNSQDVLLVIGGDGTLKAVNPAVTSVLGYHAAELLSQHFQQLVHVGDIEATYAAIAHALQAPLVKFEVRVRHKDGSYRWLAWTAAPEEGVIYANGRDITTEKQQAQQLLMASEARLQLALEAGGMGVWQWNIQTGETFWLSGMDVLHGLRSGTVPASMEDYARYIHHDDRDRVANVVLQALAEKRDHRVEYRVVWPDGSVHWVEGRSKLFLDDTGNPVQMAGVCMDITRRKRTEQDLSFLARASIELARLVDDQSTLDRLAYLAVPTFADWCTVDLVEEGGTLRRVAVAHVDPQKVRLAHDLHRRFPPDPASHSGPWHVLRTGQPEMFTEITDEMLEKTVQDKQYLAAIRDLGLKSYIGVPLSTHGKTLGVVTFIAAESGRLYGAEDLALAEDLARRAAIAIENANLYRGVQKADRGKDIFLATLSHELRNPLAPISNALSLIKLNAGDPGNVEKSVQLMERQLAQLTRLVDDLMDVSRITTGKMELKKESTDLATILKNAVETSRPHIESAHHQLSLALPGDAMALSADSVRLAQVFANLLNNAAKYTRPGGRIDVNVACTASDFIIRVRDNGVGISAGMLQNIFTIFTQDSHPIERSQGGLGIGLSLVDGLVKLHGGTVEALSQGVDKGSEFIVRLPRATDSVAEMPEASRRSNGEANEAEACRILVVDDNIDAATTVAELLEMLGHEVAIVHDGLAAVEAASGMQPDIVLLDIGLPGIDGYEAARRIRAGEGARRPVLIALTGWGQDKDKRQTAEAGFDQHWVKPVGLDKLKGISKGS